MIYGYCRVSTKKQSLERQMQNILKAYPEAVLYVEKFTGTKVEGREEFAKVLKVAKAGDTIVFDQVSRMSRNASEGFALYQDLNAKGIDLIFIKEPQINTTTYKKALENNIQMTGTSVDCILEGVNKFLIALAEEQIKLAFAQAQKEADDTHVRTSEGMKASGAGKKIAEARTGKTYQTKKSKDAKAKIKKLSNSFGGNCSDTELMEMLNISHNTLYKYKRELREEV